MQTGIPRKATPASAAAAVQAQGAALVTAGVVPSRYVVPGNRFRGDGWANLPRTGQRVPPVLDFERGKPDTRPCWPLDRHSRQNTLSRVKGCVARIVPSQIVETIDRLFTGPSKGVGTAALDHERLFHLKGVVDLLRQLPNELLTVGAAEFADLTVAEAAIESTLLRYHNGQFPIALLPVSGKDVIHTIRDVLGKCPDEFPPAATADLRFIPDQDMRESMRSDVAAVNAALQNAEWKAATVLGGAAIESLLFWKLSPPQTPQPQRDAVAKTLTNPPPPRFDRWELSHFIAVAKELRAISESTFKQADTARDYRNLIHPGRAARVKQECNRATALAAVSGLEHVINDLAQATP